MAVYNWDGTGETVGNAPTLFTNEWHGSLADWEVVTDAQADSGGKSLELTATTNDRRFLALTAAGTLSNSVRVDVRGRFYRNSDSASASLHFARVLGSGDNTSETGVNGDIGVAGTANYARINNYNAGAFNSLSDSGAAVINDSAGWYQFHFLYDPASNPNFSLSVWNDADSEPGTFDTTVNSTTISGSGKVGIGVFTGIAGGKIDWVSFGTAGDNAADLSSTDSTAPTLSSPTGTASGSTAATGTVSTDEANGTLDAVVTTSATTPSAAQIQAGQDHTGAAAAATDLNNTVSSTGVQNVSFTGLTAATTYYVHYVHEDAAANVSTAATSASFATSASETEGISLRLYNGTTALASLTGIHYLWWDSSDPSGAPDSSGTTETTDASGDIVIDLSADTALSVAGTGFLLLWKPDATVDEDSLAFASRLAVQDIS